VPLTDWPRDRLGVVVHIEDEPPRVRARGSMPACGRERPFAFLTRMQPPSPTRPRLGDTLLHRSSQRMSMCGKPLTALRKPHFASDLQGGALEDRMRNRDPIRGWGARPAAPG
jgi:hypothetical protein